MIDWFIQLRGIAPGRLLAMTSIALYALFIIGHNWRADLVESRRGE